MTELTNKERLIQDIKVVIHDAEAVLKETAGDLGEKAVAARGRLQEGLKVARERLVALEKSVVEKTKQAAQVTDQYVKENPYKTAAFCFGVGVLVGILLRRRD